jgi:hypothetical protein
VASNFGLARSQSERKRGTSAHDWWPQPWQPHRRSLDRLVWVTATWLKCWGMWHKTVRCITPVRVDSKGSGQSGHGGRTEQCLKLIRGGDLFTAGRYPGSGDHESPRRRESRRRVAGGKVHCTCDLVQSTVPSEFLSGCLTELIAEPRSQISMWQHANPPLARLFSYYLALISL